MLPLRSGERRESAQTRFSLGPSEVGGKRSIVPTFLPKHCGQIRHWHHRVGRQRQHVTIPIFPPFA